MSNIWLTANGDTFVYQFHPERNYSGSSHMSAGRDTNGSLGYMLFSFELRSAMPTGCTINNAALVLTVISSFQPSSPAVYDLLRIKSYWSAKSVTWNTLPLYQSTPQSSFAFPAIGQLSVDVTSLAQDWFSGKSAERGVMIMAKGYPSPGTYFQSATINALDTDSWPRLSVDYSLPFATIAPTFSNHHVNLIVPAGDSVKHAQDVSLMGMVTVTVCNSGPDAVSAHLEISADGVQYVPSSSTKVIADGGIAELVADLFARYLRVVIEDNASNGASADVYFQGQIG